MTCGQWFFFFCAAFLCLDLCACPHTHRSGAGPQCVVNQSVESDGGRAKASLRLIRPPLTSTRASQEGAQSLLEVCANVEGITLKEGRAALAAVRATVRGISGVATGSSWWSTTLQLLRLWGKMRGQPPEILQLCGRPRFPLNFRHTRCSDGDGCHPIEIQPIEHHVTSSVLMVHKVAAPASRRRWEAAEKRRRE